LQSGTDGSLGFFIYNHVGDRFFEFSSAGVITAATTHYIKITYNASTLETKVRVDGSVVISATASAFSGATDDSNLALTIGTAAHSTFRECELYVGPTRLTLVELLDDNDVPVDVFPTTTETEARLLLPPLLAIPTVSALNDFTKAIVSQATGYTMKITGDPVVTIPISSWQATLQTDMQNFLQCVVPGATEYLDIISARQSTEEFIIYRTVEINGTILESEMARAGMDTVRADRGPFRTTVTLQGFTEAFSGAAPATIALQDIRSSSQTVGSSSRYRCAIDWFLRPGQTATADGESFTADYINYFVTSSGDAYMDVGSRG
jgi:hypothetical protein